ncbi:hypothetical protein GCK32_016572 [Trichostrongylus colubriformis]|uniref:Receptor L-domain domain-containing protein n=1 Tax=Trichostrongylus colubriformis TaxID=6319 RepID=A0AAN8FII4_TRICO
MCVELYDTKFREVRFPNVIRWRSCKKGPALRIVGNDFLESIVFNKSIKFIRGPRTPLSSDTIVIRGNRKLSRYEIDRISSIFSTYRFFRPRVGECALPGHVEDLTQLNCNAYYGDIAFSQEVAGGVPTLGGHVDGCLVIEDTLLSDIEFIKEFHFKPSHTCENKIVGNPNLCISESLERHLHNTMNITIANNLPNECRTYIDRGVAMLLILGICFIIFSLIATCVKVWVMN